MPWFLVIFTLLGFNLTVWTLVGIIRLAHEAIFPQSPLGFRKYDLDKDKGPLIVLRMSLMSLLAGLGLSTGLLFIYIISLDSVVGYFNVNSLGHVLSSVGYAPGASVAVILSWLFFGFLGSYIRLRLIKESSLASDIIIGIIYWLGSLILFYHLTDNSQIISLAGFVVSLSGVMLSIFGGVYLYNYLGNLNISRKVKHNTYVDDNPMYPEDVAVMIPAHNEELTLIRTLDSLSRIMPRKNIFVGSDASTDETVKIAASYGANVADIRPNRGKAGVLTYLLKNFEIEKRFRAVMIVDADSEVDDHYLDWALPIFNDKRVVAIAPHVCSKWSDHWPPKWSMLFIAYRVRLYRLLQIVLRYGQTWRYTNVTSIIPGFASIYRTEAIKDIKIDAPGLIIEDFNMTFEIHKQKKGKIAYTPNVKGYTLDPHNFRGYTKQVKRWNLGFWQTVRLHGFWKTFFSVALALQIAEIIMSSFFFIFIPTVIILLAFNSFSPVLIPIYGEIRLLDIIIGVFMIDFIVTLIVAFIERKPLLIIYGLAFPFIRIIDAFLALYTLPLTYIIKSEGKWVSPKRAVANQ